LGGFSVVWNLCLGGLVGVCCGGWGGFPPIGNGVCLSGAVGGKKPSNPGLRWQREVYSPNAKKKRGTIWEGRNKPKNKQQRPTPARKPLLPRQQTGFAKMIGIHERAVWGEEKKGSKQKLPEGRERARVGNERRTQIVKWPSSRRVEQSRTSEWPLH